MGKVNVRKPIVAGRFYPGSTEEIKKQILSFLPKDKEKIDAIACMLPHAGYTYSGRVAVETASRVNIKDKVILLGPNHTGNGCPYSLMAEGLWQTPLGEVEIDSLISRELLKESRYLKDDPLAHLDEHSLEVELPILQYFRKDFKIVPIALLSDSLDSLKKLGEEIASAILGLKLKEQTLIVASSDMTHYEPEKEAQAKDKQAIEAILELDEDKLMERVKRLGITMCGYAPVITMLAAAKILGAKNAKLVKYQTSGDVTEDRESVVGYAGIALY